MRRRTLLKTAGLALAPIAAHAQAPADFYFTRLKYESGDWDAGAGAAPTVLQALTRYTNLRVDPRERVVALADARMLEAPFCYLTGRKLAQFSGAERTHFERYVRGGGFVLADDAGIDSGLFASSFEAELARMFGPKALRKLAPGHPLYSSFFQFDAAPSGAIAAPGFDDPAPGLLRAIDSGARVRVLLVSRYFGDAQRTPSAADISRFAVNIIEYALGA